MQLYLVGSLVFALIVTIFALWNSAPVSIRFPLAGEFSTSLALVIIGSATLGALVVVILGVVGHVKTRLLVNRLTKTVKEHEDTIGKLQKQVDAKGEKESVEVIEVPFTGFDLAPPVTTERHENGI